MATPQTDFLIDESSTRLVWVLNRDVKSYKGTCEGRKVEIPANYVKIPKRHLEGGNLFPYSTARQFITDYKEPQEWVMDGGGKPNPIFGVKALFDQELSREEFESIVNKTPIQIKKELAAEEKRAGKKLTEELSKVPNKTLVTDEDE